MNVLDVLRVCPRPSHVLLGTVRKEAGKFPLGGLVTGRGADRKQLSAAVEIAARGQPWNEAVVIGANELERQPFGLPGVERAIQQSDRFPGVQIRREQQV